MKKLIMSKKEGMTQLINEDGIVTPVTVLSLIPNEILHKKTKELDGYNALVIGCNYIRY